MTKSTSRITAAALFASVGVSSCFGQSDIPLERVYRLYGARASGSQSWPQFDGSNTCSSLGLSGCCTTTYPADGTYDMIKGNGPALAHAINALSRSLWDLDGSWQVDNLGDTHWSHFYVPSKYYEEELQDSSYSSATELPTIPAFVDPGGPLATIQNDARTVLSHIESHLVAHSARSDSAGGVLYTNIRPTTTSNVRFSFCDDVNIPDEAKMEYAVLNATSFINGQVGSHAGFSGGYNEFTDNDGKCSSCGGGDRFCWAWNWSTGYLEYSGSHGGYVDVFLSLDNPSDGGTNLPGPVPRGAGFRFLGTLDDNGKLEVPIPRPPAPPNVGQHTNGWGVDAGNGIGNDPNFIARLRSRSYREPDFSQCEPSATFDSPVSDVSGFSSDGRVPLWAECDELVGDSPIAYATGHKAEMVVDLVVALPGEDWKLTRTYTSEPALLSDDGNLLGRGWTSDAFRALNIVDGSGGDPEDRIVRVTGGARHKTVEMARVDEDLWAAGGPTSQTLLKDVVSIDGTSRPVWQLEEPGQWTIDYFRDTRTSHDRCEDCGDTTQGPVLVNKAFSGLPARYRDLYGNQWLYQYYFDGATDTQTRLRAIYFNGSPNDGGSLAVAVFHWVQSGTLTGLLDSVVVMRPVDGTNELITAQRVDYVYAAEVTGLSGDVGSDQDLVEVRSSLLVDSSELEDPGIPVYHTTVTQYRYHAGSWTTGDEDERANIGGAAGQLKMVIEPEQIEFLAQSMNAGGSLDADEALRAAADDLLDADDDAAAAGTAYTPRELASKIVSYETMSGGGQGRASVQYLQAGCGCSGAGAQGLKQAYSYMSGYVWSGDDGLTTKVEEYSDNAGSWQLHRIRYKDMRELGGVPYLIYDVVAAPSPDGRVWVHGYEYDSEHNISTQSYPSRFNASAYSPATTTTAPNVSDDGTGYKLKFEYTADNRLAKTYVFDDTLSSPSFSLITETTYPTTGRIWLPTETIRYRKPSADGSTGLAASDKEVTQYAYFFFDATDDRVASDDALSAVEVSQEAETDAENGPGNVEEYKTYELYDRLGRNSWSVSADNSLTYRAFDPNTGEVTARVRNAARVAPGGDDRAGFAASGHGSLEDSPSIHSDWGWQSDEYSVKQPLPGGELAEFYGVDPLGRVRSHTSPGGVSVYTRRELRADELHPGILYFSTVVLPHDLGTGESPRFDAPATVTWHSASGSVLRESEFVVADETYDPMEGEYSLETDPEGFDAGELARSASFYTVTGLVELDRKWHDIDRDAFDDVEYEYDSLGRVANLTQPNGTINAFTYDALDRRIAFGVARVGSGSETPTVVEQMFFDTDPDAGSPSQGVGDGLVTLVKHFPGEGGDRLTRRYYDERNRLIGTVLPESPSQSVAYDNLDRPVAIAQFTSGGSGSPPAPSVSTNRGGLKERSYSQRGLVYRSQVAIDPAQSTPDYLETHSWFDANGREVAVLRPSSPMEVRQFDTHSRVLTSYATDRGDAIPGDDYEEAVTPDNHKVIEQIVTAYDAENRQRARVRFRRLHDDDSSVGPLDTSNAVTDYQEMFYDDADRVVAVADYGTGSTEFGADQDLPDMEYEAGVNPAPPAPTDEVLVTQFVYDNRAKIAETVDPSGLITRILFDDCGRMAMQVENAVNVDKTMVDWVTGSASYENRWSVSGLVAANPDQDRAISYVYNGNGHVVRRVAHHPVLSGGATVEGAQITEYVYGTDAGSSSTNTNSLVASGSLLRAVLFPKESTGVPVTNPSDGDYAEFAVRYAYNQLGELRSAVDQNGTVHAFTRDGLGRVATDVAASIDQNASDGNGVFIDGSVRRITTTYDAMGRVADVTSYDSTTGGGIVNQIAYEYTPLGLIESVHQDHNGAVSLSGGSDTRSVAYEYDVQAGPGNSRLTSVVYPSEYDPGDPFGTPTLTIKYGSGNSIDDRISRPSSRSVDGVGTSQDLVSYGYLGLDTIVQVRYPAAGGPSTDPIQLSPEFQDNGDSSPGAYPGLDRFGRAVRQQWVDPGYVALDSSLPAIPPLVRISHEYNRNSLRTETIDTRPGAHIEDRDFEFLYDGLNRLRTSSRSDYSVPTASGSGSYQWALDTHGNWSRLTQDKNANGAYTSPSDPFTTRTSNAANEALSTATTTYSGVLAQPGVARDWSYDRVGNVTVSDKRSAVSPHTQYEYVYDAWNRLVDVDFKNLAGNYVTVVHNEYNGLGWRVLREIDSKKSGHDGLDERRIYAYTADWQFAEEQIDANYSSSPGVDRIGQQYWGQRYIDDAVARRVNHNPGGTPDYSEGVFFYLTDSQYNVVGVVRDGGGAIVERRLYTPYGEAEHKYIADVNDDGSISSADLTLIQSLSGDTIDLSTYVADADYDRNGTIDSIDEATYTLQDGRVPLPAGWLSDPADVRGTGDPRGPDDSIGFAGAVFDPPTGMYMMRHRVYSPRWGRFLQRDPSGYIDGTNLYEYVRSDPVNRLDPMGLDSTWFSGVTGLRGTWVGNWIDNSYEGAASALSGENIGASYAYDVGAGIADTWDRIVGNPYAEENEWIEHTENVARRAIARHIASGGCGNIAGAMSISTDHELGAELHAVRTELSFAVYGTATSIVPPGTGAKIVSRSLWPNTVRSTGTRSVDLLSKRASSVGSANSSRLLDTTSAGKRMLSYFPPNRGFAGQPGRASVIPGAIVDRYGGTGGFFLSPRGTPVWARSLPHGADARPLTTYRALKPFEVDAGQVAPWFGQPGGGTQYDLGTRTVRDLIDGGYLEIVR